jgi:hypothetical protein
MRLVRRFARSPVQPRYVKSLPNLPGAASLAVPRTAPRPVPRRSVVVPGAKVRGTALWWSGVDAAARWRRGIHRVDFFVDGKLLWSDRVWPFAFRGGAGWNTRTVADGRHLLSLRLHGRRGYRVRRTIPVRVDNPRMALAISGLGEHGAARGRVTLGVRAGEPIERIALYVDGRAVSRDATPPYRLHWDSTTAAEGPKQLLVYARAASGRRAARHLPVVVANADDLPASLDLALGGAPVPPPGP